MQFYIYIDIHENVIDDNSAFGLGNRLVLIRLQAITWTSDDQDLLY